MPLLCHLDQTTHASREDLHVYIRRFKLRQEDYYLTYHPRKDLADGRPIPFKTVDQYLSQDFVDKNSMNRWLKTGTPETATWLREWLHRRKCEKQLIYAPSQVELKTLSGPSMGHFEALGGYYEVCRDMGFATRFCNDTPLFTLLPSDATIICDTREQNPVNLAVPMERGTLNVGDYALKSPHDYGIRIERKSLSDFCGTLSDRPVRGKDGEPTGQTPLNRFDAELTRAEKQGLYVVMVVEASLSDAQSFDHLPQTRWVRAKPAYILKNLRDLLVKYSLTFQALFVDGRIEMAQKLPKLFQLGHQVKSLDLQFLYERGLL